MGGFIMGALGGCGGGPSLMPLAVGKRWTYLARYGIDEQRVETIAVRREIAVAGGHGYELGGPLGTARLGWVGGTLYADQTANAFFAPSIPVLTEDGRPPRSWSGSIRVGTRTFAATSRLEQAVRPTKLTIFGQTYSARSAKLTITIPASGGTIVLDSWYEPGVGLVQQEQRTNRDLVVTLQLVTAPS